MKTTKVLSKAVLLASILFAVILFTGNNSFAQANCCGQECSSMSTKMSGCTMGTDCSASTSCASCATCTSCSTGSGCSAASCSKNSAGGMKDSTKDNVAIKTVTSETGMIQTVDPVTGEAVGEGSGVKFEYMGTTYVFANDASLAKFKSEPFDYVKNLECPVMGDAAAKENSVMFEGTKYYLCCSSCEKAFKKDPKKYIQKKEKSK